MEARECAPEQRPLQNHHERLWPAVQLADPVERLPVRPALAGLERPLVADAHAEAPRGMTDTQSRYLTIAAEQVVSIVTMETVPTTLFQ